MKLVSRVGDGTVDREGAETAMIELVRRPCRLDVTTQQPDELVRLVRRAVKNVRIVRASLPVLSFLQLGAELVMETLQALSEISCGRDGGTFGELGFEGRVEAIVGEEGRLVGGRVHVVVERELGKREVINPVVLLVRRVRAEVRLECLIGTLGQSVRLRVISR